MKKVQVFSKLNEHPFQGIFETEQKANEWIDRCVSNNSWGKPERVVNYENCSEEDLESALEIIPEVVETIPAREPQEILDENGNSFDPPEFSEAMPETVNLISSAMVRLPCEYKIVVTDITSEVEQRKINNKALKFLQETDWKVLRHARQKTLGEETTLTEQEYLALEQQRADAASRVIR